MLLAMWAPKCFSVQDTVHRRSGVDNTSQEVGRALRKLEILRAHVGRFPSNDLDFDFVRAGFCFRKNP